MKEIVCGVRNFIPLRGSASCPALEDNGGESALTHYAQWLDEDSPHRDEDEERPPLSDEEKQARVKLLTEARAPSTWSCGSARSATSAARTR